MDLTESLAAYFGVATKFRVGTFKDFATTQGSITAISLLEAGGSCNRDIKI